MATILRQRRHDPPKGWDEDEARVKKRGSRRRGGKTVEIWTANASGKPQLEKAVVEATRLRGAGRNVAAIL